MNSVSVNDARRQFANLVSTAGSGRSVTITRRGKAIAQIGPIKAPSRPRLPDLSDLRASLGKHIARSKATIRQLRSRDRY